MSLLAGTAALLAGTAAPLADAAAPLADAAPAAKITSMFIIDEEPVGVSMRRIIFTIVIVVIIIFLFFHMKPRVVKCDTAKIKETQKSRDAALAVPAAPPNVTSPSMDSPAASSPLSVVSPTTTSTAAAPALMFKEKNDSELVAETWRSSDSLAQPPYIVAATYAPGDIATIAAGSEPHASPPLVISYDSNETLDEHQLAKNLQNFSQARALSMQPEWIRNQQTRRRYSVNEPNLYGSSYSYMGNLYSEGTKYV